MKKTILGLILTSSLIVSTSMSFASGLGFANVQDIFETSPLGKIKVMEDEKKFKPEIEKLKHKVRSLQEKLNTDTDNISEKNDLENDSYNKLDIKNKSENEDKEQTEIDLEKAIKDYQDLINQVQKNVTKDVENFKNLLTKASSEIAHEKQFDAILPAEISLYNVDSIDVTKDILAKMK